MAIASIGLILVIILAIIFGLAIIGGIIFLIIYLISKDKNKEKKQWLISLFLYYINKYIVGSDSREDNFL